MTCILRIGTPLVSCASDLLTLNFLALLISYCFLSLFYSLQKPKSYQLKGLSPILCPFLYSHFYLTLNHIKWLRCAQIVMIKLAK
jgi:hypothetical protein